MNTVAITDKVQYGSKEIEYIMRRSHRKTLEISVEPDTSISVLAPFEVSDTAIREKIKKRARWIIRQQIYFTNFLPLMPKKEYVSGESFRYLGYQYRLKVIESKNVSFNVVDKRLIVTVNNINNKDQIKKLIENWYLLQAKQYFLKRLEKLWSLFSKDMQPFPPLLLRKMTKRWGSYTRSGKILLNIDLIQAPSHCIDYVIAHELCHIFHRNHSSEFFALLKNIMPDWQLRKERLEKI